MRTCTVGPMASDYNHLDDVPMSIRNTLAQSPAFSIITDNQSPEAIPQTHIQYVTIRNSTVTTPLANMHMNSRRGHACIDTNANCFLRTSTNGPRPGLGPKVYSTPVSVLEALALAQW